MLQAVAAAVLTARNKRVWSILGCYAVLLFFTRVYVVPSGSSIGITVEVIAVNGFPLHCLLVGAAVMPGQPPREAQNIVIRRSRGGGSLQGRAGPSRRISACVCT